jgi:nitrogen fixation NifU-like protein
MYNKTVLDHFQNPRNLVVPKEYDASGTAVNPICGDVLNLYLQVENQQIKKAYFKTMGCGAAIASGSILTELLPGKSLADAAKMDTNTLAEALGGLPAIKMHCPELAIDALKNTLKNLDPRFRGDDNVL